MGVSDRCPECGEALEAYSAEARPRDIGVESTHAGILELDVRFKGKCPACGSSFGFTARYRFVRGEFD